MNADYKLVESVHHAASHAPRIKAMQLRHLLAIYLMAMDHHNSKDRDAKAIAERAEAQLRSLLGGLKEL